METLETVLSKPVPKRVLITIGLALGLIIIIYLGFWIALQLSDTLSEQQVQQALDRDCGEGTVSAKDGYYSFDPQFRWESAKASCYTDLVSGEFTCHCPQ